MLRRLALLNVAVLLCISSATALAQSPSPSASQPPPLCKDDWSSGSLACDNNGIRCAVPCTPDGTAQDGGKTCQCKTSTPTTTVTSTTQPYVGGCRVKSSNDGCEQIGSCYGRCDFKRNSKTGETSCTCSTNGCNYKPDSANPVEKCGTPSGGCKTGVPLKPRGKCDLVSLPDSGCKCNPTIIRIGIGSPTPFP